MRTLNLDEWCVEITDYPAHHGLDVEAELTRLLSEDFFDEIVREMDEDIKRKILRTIRKAANKRKKQKRAYCK